MIPYVAFSNNELDKLPPIKSGDEIICPHCGKSHVIHDATGQLASLCFYQCGSTTYLAGVGGRNVISKFLRKE